MLIATVLGMLMVVSTFLASAFIVRRHSQARDHVESLAQNGAPSVRLLGQARSDARELHIAARKQQKGHPAPGQLQRSRQSLEEHLAAQRLTPLYPGEEESRRAVDDSVARLDTLIARADWPAVRKESERLDFHLQDLHHLNALGLQEDAANLVAEQRKSLLLALRLDALGLGVAVVVTLGLLRLIRRQLAMEAERRTTAEARATELNAFSARVAHDLMSPLATVSLALGANHPSELGKRALRALQRARTIVADLLDFSRSGGRPPRGARSSVPEVVAGVADELRPIAALQNIQLESEDVPPCAVNCEPGILAVVLTNLINNAIKFMGARPERWIGVRVEALPGRVRFAVDDTGPGLPPGFEAIAFDPYQRAVTGVPGLGIGLATVKRLVEAHGGKVGVVARDHSGSTFWFELPRAIAEAAAPALRPQPA
jgi:signal transduction histidine kinase